MRPLSTDHGGVLELADAGGPKRPPGLTHDPHPRVPRNRSTLGLTRCARGRHALRPRSVLGCHTPGLRGSDLNDPLALRCEPQTSSPGPSGGPETGLSRQAPVLPTGPGGADTGGSDVVLVADLVRLVVPALPSHA